MSTPKWSNQVAGGSLASGSVNQNLGTHQTQEIFEGASIVTTTVNLKPPTPLLSTNSNGTTTAYKYSQPFTMSGTEIDRVVLPLTVLNGIGQDVTVQIFTDNSGSPSTTSVTGAFVVPREFIQGISSGMFPDFYVPNASSWTQAQNLTNPVPLTSTMLLTDGSYITLTGGYPPNEYTPNNEISAVIQSPLSFTSAGAVAPAGDPGGNTTANNTGVSFAGIATKGGIAFVGGGYSNTSTGALMNSKFTYTASYANGQVGSWQQQSNLPFPAVGGQAVIVGPATTGANIGTYKVYMFGSYAWQTFSSTTYTTSTAQDSNPTSPKWATNQFAGCVVAALGASSVSAATVASNTSNTVTISGAWNNGTPSNNSAFVINSPYLGYAATMSSTGVIAAGAWSNILPPGSFSASGGQIQQFLQQIVAVVNGYIVIAGGTTYTATAFTNYPQVIAAKINSDNTIGPWRPWPNLASATSAPAVGVFQNTLWAVDGDQVVAGSSTRLDSQIVQALTVGPRGPASSWTITNSIPTHAGIFQNGGVLPVTQAGTAIGVGTNQAAASGPWNGGIVGTLGNVPVVSVPLRVTGLTTSTKYHIVISPVTTGYGGSDSYSDVTGIQIGNSLAGGGAFTALQAPVGTTTWTTLTTGLGIPMTLYQGGSGRWIHYLEDVTNQVPARQTWIIYDSLVNDGGSSVVAAVGEAVGNARSFKTMVYNTDGTLAYTGSAAGAGFMTAGYSPGGSTPGLNLQVATNSSTTKLVGSSAATSFTSTSATDTASPFTASLYPGQVTYTGLPGSTTAPFATATFGAGCTIADSAGNTATVSSAVYTASTTTLVVTTATTWSPSTPTAGATFTISVVAQGVQNPNGGPIGFPMVGAGVAGIA